MPHRTDRDRENSEYQPETQRTIESHRPPNLNPACLGHGGQAGNLQNGGDGECGPDAAEREMTDVHVCCVEVTDPPSDEDMSDNESVDGQEGDETIHEIGDLGPYSMAEIRRVTAIFQPCRCNNCSCYCQIIRAQTPNGSMGVSPSYSRVPTPIGSMIVEVGSMASSMSLDANWNPADLLAFVHPGMEEGDFVYVIPQGFVQPPLRLTATPAVEMSEYIYATELDELDDFVRF